MTLYLHLSPTPDSFASVRVGRSLRATVLALRSFPETDWPWGNTRLRRSRCWRWARRAFYRDDFLATEAARWPDDPGTGWVPVDPSTGKPLKEAP